MNLFCKFESEKDIRRRLKIARKLVNFLKSNKSRKLGKSMFLKILLIITGLVAGVALWKVVKPKTMPIISRIYYKIKEVITKKPTVNQVKIK